MLDLVRNPFVPVDAAHTPLYRSHPRYKIRMRDKRDHEDYDEALPIDVVLDFSRRVFIFFSRSSSFDFRSSRSNAT